MTDRPIKRDPTRCEFRLLNLIIDNPGANYIELALQYGCSYGWVRLMIKTMIKRGCLRDNDGNGRALVPTHWGLCCAKRDPVTTRELNKAEFQLLTSVV